MNCKSVVNLAVMLLVASLASWAADDGAALYKKKCAGCHGAERRRQTRDEGPRAEGHKPGSRSNRGRT